MKGGDSGAGADSGSSGGSSSEPDRTGPGYEVEPEKEKPALQIIVNGDMFDSSATWSRIAELSREFGEDNRVFISRGAVA